jgi:hypothetical protein
MIKNMKTETLARKYITSNGHKSKELIRTDDGRLLYAINCDIDARQEIPIEDARAFWDAAPYKTGERP